jgi:hypothetical protein
MTWQALCEAVGSFFDVGQGVGSPDPVSGSNFADGADWHNDWGTAADFQVPAESFSSPDFCSFD